MRLRTAISIIGIFTGLLPLIPYAMGQGFYSYRDSNGARVFTNIPPSNEQIIDEYIRSDERLDSKAPAPEKTPAVASNKFESIIRKYASYYKLDPSLIHSIIETESNFNPKAVSSKGAKGLMQLMPETAERLGVKDIFDPDQNIRGGVRHFRSLMDMFNNNIDLSLAAYNAGENLVRRLGRIPAYEETINYVRTVTRRYNEKLKYTQNREEKGLTQTFRYTDAAGVLHLTNIPPVR